MAMFEFFVPLGWPLPSASSVPCSWFAEDGCSSLAGKFPDAHLRFLVHWPLRPPTASWMSLPPHPSLGPWLWFSWGFDARSD